MWIDYAVGTDCYIVIWIDTVYPINYMNMVVFRIALYLSH